MTDRTTEEARKAFIAVANERGYDTAHAYDTDRSRWVFFNPMTADLWAFWQAALQWQAEQQKGDDGRGLEACVTCGQPAASPHGVPPKPTRENGPFKASQSPSGKTFICSDDFHHDVTLTVQGDFGDDALKLRYAEYLAAILTAGISSLPQAPQGEQ